VALLKENAANFALLIYWQSLDRTSATHFTDYYVIMLVDLRRCLAAPTASSVITLIALKQLYTPHKTVPQIHHH
jgi:hypothetical protein